jgi:4-hydroxy-2-oxoheptanedioate aldolase
VDPDAVHRGFRSEDFAMQAWGMSREDYLEKADPWPLNPRGELLLGIKIESPKATTLADELLAVPGISLVEWAPGDQSFFMFPKPYMITRQTAMQDPRMVASRNRVHAAAVARKVAVLALCTPETVASQIRSAVTACYVNDDLTIERGRAAAIAPASASSPTETQP